ncbi:hypothetical protein GTZ78_09560 [Streptomyces sp. SID8361]|uniref:hypothetical protein n=1 Tax=Streptomyces sp. MnatMP-M27 TaxID=1839768 RepID=UPI00081E4B1F|nr:hypothetical protein [Streptomyces sp. MnatMP-M27]MYU10933.1 hypothetical protein [Streptomyces sp. SID8361]SCF76632.1 hypothetical protein GA0115260_102288 [Streptomyces sp. MnatMP-M27]
MFAKRVLVEFNGSNEDSAIPLSWVEAAAERWYEWDVAGCPPVEGRRVLDVDVARSGGGRTVIAHRHGLIVTSLEAHDREDAMQTTARVQSG